jgi:hypothetical protein
MARSFLPLLSLYLKGLQSGFYASGFFLQMSVISHSKPKINSNMVWNMLNIIILSEYCAVAACWVSLFLGYSNSTAFVVEAMSSPPIKCL